ncbi:glycosyltransferase family 87 protein [Acidobacteriota bacterium]
MTDRRAQISCAARRLAWAYLIITASTIAYVLVIAFFKGREGLLDVLRPGPLSDLHVTVLFVGIAWILAGTVLVLLIRGAITQRNIVFYLSLYLLAFLYVNTIRERNFFGDFPVYYKAAQSLNNGEPFEPTYLYPPLWATCIQPFAPLGEKATLLVCLSVNFISLLLFFVLLDRILQRYGFSPNLARLLSLAALGINAAVLRNMLYVQVNIHLANLILLCMLLYRSHRFLAALALGLAVHLKVTPLVLVIPFLLKKDWKWLGYFAIALAAVFLLTSAVNSPDYYLDFFNNIRDIRRDESLVLDEMNISLRDCSVDSVVRATSVYLHLNPTAGTVIIWIIKLLVLLASLHVLSGCLRNRVFYENGEDAVIFNSFPVLLFLMVMLSPIVWVHHLVLVIFPIIVFLKKTSKVEEIALWGAAYFLVFLVPTFDFFPLSFHRLLGLALAFVLLWTFRKRSSDSDWFVRWNRGGIHSILSRHDVDTQEG